MTTVACQLVDELVKKERAAMESGPVGSGSGSSSPANLMHAGQDVTSVTGLARYLGDWTTCYVWDMYMHRYRLESSSNDNKERRGLAQQA